MLTKRRWKKMAAEKDSLVKQYLNIAAVVSAYWFVSITLVFVNKQLLSEDDAPDAPLFITWFQCVITIVLCAILGFGSQFCPQCLTFSPVTLNINLMLQVMPLSIVFIAMISFNNLCLKYVDVSFYYIGRSLTTVFNVILTFVILRQKTSFQALACCAIIIVGFFMGVDQEKVSGSLSVLGITFGVLASLFVALYSIYIKKALPLVSGDVSSLVYYNNLNAIILFIPVMVLAGEVPSIFGFKGYFSEKFWIPMLVSGLFGFGISYLTNLQVKVTSPLTNNISGTAKACAQTVLASGIYGEKRSALWWVSNAVVLLGSGFYTRVKQLEMQKAHRESKLVDEEAKKPLQEIVLEGKPNVHGPK